MKLFGKDKEIRVTKRMLFFRARVQEMLNLVLEEEAKILDFTFTSEVFSKVHVSSVYGPGGKIEANVINGHFVIKNKLLPFEATILTNSLGEGVASTILEFDAEHDVTVDGRKFRAYWEYKENDDHVLRVQRFDIDSSIVGWKKADILLRLDQLPWGKISSQRVEAVLYSLGIRTLGHLLQWKESQIWKESNDISILEGARWMLTTYGYNFKAE